jgi:hypothetical protein
VHRGFRFASSGTTRQSYGFIVGLFVDGTLSCNKGFAGVSNRRGGNSCYAFQMLESFFHENRFVGIHFDAAPEISARFIIPQAPPNNA